MSETWSAEDYQTYLNTGKEPEKEPKQVSREREVVEVRGGRHHRKLVRRPDLGLTFDSLTEERRYDWLIAQPEIVHVDVHPILQLPHGIRYQADFCVHFAPLGGGFMPCCRVEDVKSKRGMTTEFRRLKRIFDQTHPFAPLVVVQWISKQWKTTEGEM